MSKLAFTLIELNVAFGVAPAMMLFFSIGYNYGKFGALASVTLSFATR
jgi:phosphatidylserine synthase